MARSHVLAEPADRRSLGELARSVGSSRRTLTRLFAAETGMPFQTGRTQVRVHAGVNRLAAGQPVTQTAFAGGHATPSAFTAAFTQIHGVAQHSGPRRGTTSR